MRAVLINVGDTFTTGPTKAAFVINELVKANSVIPSHANELATQDGKPVAGSRTEAFLNAVKVASFLPLSGRTLEFDAEGRCTTSC